MVSEWLYIGVICGTECTIMCGVKWGPGLSAPKMWVLAGSWSAEVKGGDFGNVRLETEGSIKVGVQWG